MKRSEWRVYTIVRPLGPQPWPFGGHEASVTRRGQDEWEWAVRETPLTKPRASGVAPSRHYAIVRANRAAAKLGWTTSGAGIAQVRR